MDSIAAKGWCEIRKITISFLPGDGMTIIWRKGPIVAVRHKGHGENHSQGSFASYTIYCLRFTHSSSAICAELMGDSDKIKIIRIVSGHGYHSSSISVSVDAPSKSYDWQSKIAKQARESYKIKKKESFLICGKPGVGKSETSVIIADVLKKSFDIEPYVVEGFSLTTGGITIESMPKPTDKNPVVVVLNEIDTVFAYAGDGTKKGDKFHTMAQDPEALTGTLDWMNRMDNLIVVATSNKTLKYLSTPRKNGEKKEERDEEEVENFERYIRNGRFNHKFQVPDPI